MRCAPRRRGVDDHADARLVERPSRRTPDHRSSCVAVRAGRWLLGARVAAEGRSCAARWPGTIPGPAPPVRRSRPCGSALGTGAGSPSRGRRDQRPRAPAEQRLAGCARAAAPASGDRRLRQDGGASPSRGRSGRPYEPSRGRRSPTGVGISSFEVLAAPVEHGGERAETSPAPWTRRSSRRASSHATGSRPNGTSREHLEATSQRVESSGPSPAAHACSGET